MINNIEYKTCRAVEINRLGTLTNDISNSLTIILYHSYEFTLHKNFEKRSLVNIVGKGENAGANQHFLLFLLCFRLFANISTKGYFFSVEKKCRLEIISIL